MPPIKPTPSLTGKILTAYAVYLALNALHGFATLWSVSRDPAPPPRHELLLAAACPLVMLMNVRWVLAGRASRTFQAIQLLARALALGLFLGTFLPTTDTDSAPPRQAVVSDDPVKVPHFSRAFGLVEAAFLAVQTLAMAADSLCVVRGPAPPLPASTASAPTASLWRRAFRGAFGLLLIAAGFGVLLDTKRTLALLGFPTSDQILYSTRAGLAHPTALLDLPGTAIAAGWLSPWVTPGGSAALGGRGVAPVLLASCFTRLLGMFNLGAAMFAIEPLLKAGEQGGIAFGSLMTVLAVFGVVPVGALFVPLVDVAVVAASTFASGEKKKQI
jgi:hypothetical protein